ncbi:MAG TPA: hypothetical protein VGS07_07295 [Thermoanaerobaculia bacterium]|jgi:hypothetical protein|nr:hypothetical protein [Thermoanaerobaculia bacterium]
MGNETTYSGVLGELGRLGSALSANAADLPHLEGPRGRLDQIYGEAQQVAQQQAALTATKQEASKRLKVLLVEGKRVANGLSRFLKEHYGTRSEKLTEFGLKPFRGRAPKAATSAPEPPPTSSTPVVSLAADTNPNP